MQTTGAGARREPTTTTAATHAGRLTHVSPCSFTPPADRRQAARLTLREMRLYAPLLLVVAVLFAAPVAAQRLPTGVTPEHYDLGFVVDLAHERFDGSEAIRVNVTAPTARIVLNAVDIDFREVTIGTGGSIQTATVTSDATAQTATFTVPRPIPAGSTEIHVRYGGTLNSQLRGLYISKTKVRKYAVTQFEST